MFDMILFFSRHLLFGMLLGGVAMTIWWLYLEIKGYIDEGKRSKK